MQLIIGAGAVGGVLAAYMLRAGQAVSFLVRPERLAYYRAAKRLVMTHASGEAAIDLPAPEILAQLPSSGIERVYIAVKHPALEGVLADLEKNLPAGVPVVSCLNGVGVADILRQRLPRNPVQAMTIMYNSATSGALQYLLTTRAIVLLDGSDTDYLKRLRATGMRVGRGGETVAWGKLLINLNNALGALTHTTFKDMLCERSMRRLFVETLDEAVQILQAAGVDYHLPLPLRYRYYRLLMLYAGALPWRMARKANGLTDSAHPSMSADIAAGRPTEVDQLNGVISALGRKTGLPTPINDEIVRLIKKLEQQTPKQFFAPRDLRRHLRASKRSAKTRAAHS